MNPTLLLWGLIFSSIGLGIFIHGKKRQSIVQILCGLALMVYPYFIPNTIALVAIGLALIAASWFISA
ncbi:MAG: hypothetical protein ACOZBW_13085 [Thermodesulfobacteriota bacterium]